MIRFYKTSIIINPYRNRWQVIKDIIEKLKEKLKIYIDSEKDKVWYKRRYMQILVGILAVLIAIIGIVTSAHKNNASVEELDNEVPVAAAPEEKTPADDIEVVPAQQNTDTMVTISLEDTGRADPFLPSADYEAIAALSAPTAKMPYYMVPPPESAGYDQTAVDVVKTKVSGIMYDRYNPSAILNINDTDYLVRTGETINNYKVLAISPSTVTVQLGVNTYRAGVGEMFSGEDMNYVNDSFGSARRR